MALLSGRFVRQAIVDAFRPNGLFATTRTRAAQEFQECVTRYRGGSYCRKGYPATDCARFRTDIAAVPKSASGNCVHLNVEWIRAPGSCFPG